MNTLDVEVSALARAGDLDAAATRVLRELGPEVFGFLCAVQTSEADARDAFSLFSEHLWRSLARFEGRCSVRSWAYLLARHAIADVAGGHRHGDRITGSVAEQMEAAIRTTTVSWLRTERAEKLRALRAHLSQEDQVILVLRVDRDLSWRDVARAFLPVEPSPSDAVLDKESARIRKRFETLLTRLRVLSREHGLLP